MAKHRRRAAGRRGTADKNSGEEDDKRVSKFGLIVL